MYDKHTRTKTQEKNNIKRYTHLVVLWIGVCWLKSATLRGCVGFWGDDFSTKQSSAKMKKKITGDLSAAQKSTTELLIFIWHIYIRIIGILASYMLIRHRNEFLHVHALVIRRTVFSIDLRTHTHTIHKITDTANTAQDDI